VPLQLPSLQILPVNISQAPSGTQQSVPQATSQESPVGLPSTTANPSTHSTKPLSHVGIPISGRAASRTLPTRALSSPLDRMPTSRISATSPSCARDSGGASLSSIPLPPRGEERWSASSLWGAPPRPGRDATPTLTSANASYVLNFGTRLSSGTSGSAATRIRTCPPCLDD